MSRRLVDLSHPIHHGMTTYPGLPGPEVSTHISREDSATRLAEGAPNAIRWTKYALNNWLRQAGPVFDASLALEFLGFAGPEVKEGLASHLEKRKPQFPPDTEV